jgi:hypothetical protein
MKRLIFSFLVIASLILSFGIQKGYAQTADNTWSGSIVVFYPKIKAPTDPKGTPAKVGVVYYSATAAGDTNAYPTWEENLDENASRTYLVGKALPTGSYEGGAIVSADQPVMAIYKHAPFSGMGNPSFYSSMDFSDAGNDFYFPLVDNGSGKKAVVGVQNVSVNPVSISFSFYDGNGNQVGGTFSDPNNTTLGSLASRVYDLSVLESSFTGSLVIHSNDKIVAVLEEQDSSMGGYSYEGMSQGNTPVFFPSVFCSYSRQGLTSRVYIQNTGTDASNVKLTFYNLDGSQAGFLTKNTIKSNQSVVYDPCDVIGAGKSVSAVLTGANVVGIVKTTDSTSLTSVYTARTSPNSKGSDNIYRMVLPYVFWSQSDSGYQTFLSLMNVGSSTDSNIHVKYYYAETGTEGLDHQLAALEPDAKVDTNPFVAPGLIDKDANYFDGAVIIESSQPLQVVARVQRRVTSPTGSSVYFGDEYTGLPFLN